MNSILNGTCMALRVFQYHSMKTVCIAFALHLAGSAQASNDGKSSELATDVSVADPYMGGWYGEDVQLSGTSFEEPPMGYHWLIKNVDFRRSYSAHRKLQTTVDLKLVLHKGTLNVSDAVHRKLLLRPGFKIGSDLGWHNSDGFDSHYRLRTINLNNHPTMYSLEKYFVAEQLEFDERFYVGQTAITLGADISQLPRLDEPYIWTPRVSEPHYNRFILEVSNTRSGGNIPSVVHHRRIIKNVLFKASNGVGPTVQDASLMLSDRGQRPMMSPIAIKQSGKKSPQHPR